MNKLDVARAELSAMLTRYLASDPLDTLDIRAYRANRVLGEIERLIEAKQEASHAE